jgi:anti-sigma factor RsiW
MFRNTKMSNHLSQRELAKCIVGRPARAELQHIGECPECGAELDRLRNTLTVFRNAVRHRIDERVASQPPLVVPLRVAEAGVSTWRWTLVAAAMVMAIVLPFFINTNQPQETADPAAIETNPDAIMNRVNLHLSRTVPAPMEPMMTLIPREELMSKPGGVQ